MTYIFVVFYITCQLFFFSNKSFFPKNYSNFIRPPPLHYVNIHTLSVSTKILITENTTVQIAFVFYWRYPVSFRVITVPFNYKEREEFKEKKSTLLKLNSLKEVDFSWPTLSLSVFIIEFKVILCNNYS